MSSLCYKCANEIDEEKHDYAECDSCDSLFHIECGNVLKKELNARKNSKCLQLYCPDCFDQKTDMKLIVKLLYKLDLFNQNSKIDNPINQQLSSIQSQLNVLNNNIKDSSQCNVEKVGKQATSYAEVVSRPAVKPTVVIKPKTKQKSAETFKAIESNVNKEEVKICSTRNAREGGIVLQCANANETMKVKQIIGEKLGDNYEVILPKVKCPRVRISNIDDKIPKDKIIDELKKANESIQNMQMRLITVIPRKRKANSTNDIVIEVNSASFKQLIEIGSLDLPWRECKVSEHIHVNRCYKCCGFFHKSTECKHAQKCSRCGGDHKHSDCKSNKLCCVNCKNANEKFKLKNDYKHHAWSGECPVLKRHLASVVRKIEYNPTE